MIFGIIFATLLTILYATELLFALTVNRPLVFVESVEFIIVLNFFFFSSVIFGRYYYICRSMFNVSRTVNISCQFKLMPGTIFSIFSSQFFIFNLNLLYLNLLSLTITLRFFLLYLSSAVDLTCRQERAL